jgi:hypothetical protein
MTFDARQLNKFTDRVRYLSVVSGDEVEQMRNLSRFRGKIQTSKWNLEKARGTRLLVRNSSGPHAKDYSAVTFERALLRVHCMRQHFAANKPGASIGQSNNTENGSNSGSAH